MEVGASERLWGIGLADDVLAPNLGMPYWAIGTMLLNLLTASRRDGVEAYLSGQAFSLKVGGTCPVNILLWGMTALRSWLP